MPFLFTLPTLGFSDEKDSFSSPRLFLSFFSSEGGGGLSQIWSSLPCFLEFSLHSDCCWLMATVNIGVRGGLRFFGDSEGFFFVFKQSLLVYPRFGLSEEFYFLTSRSASSFGSSFLLFF